MSTGAGRVSGDLTGNAAVTKGRQAPADNRRRFFCMLCLSEALLIKSMLTTRFDAFTMFPLRFFPRSGKIA